MLQNLAIVHRRKPRIFTGTHVPVWSTCLRSLAFADGKPDFELHSDDEIYTQERAYQFLLEIVCGLHSPIVGETEVFGQFKAFAQAWCELDPRRMSLVQRLLNEAKTIRAAHLSHMGTQSYGSWLRKNLDCKRVHVIGAGHLSREILPYLAKHAEVVVHSRDPRKVDFHQEVQALDARAFDEGALVIAAPVTAADVRRWLAGAKPKQIIDLRDTSTADPIRADAIPLEHIFGDIRQAKARLLPVVERIKSEILSCSRSLAAEEKVRPQGWDDLCA
ncbi:MAG: hypothetical protein KF799_13435 [Bdellovibrionales bacterium]|nr:hypothetical protein [Bdellovibrionales bacterium]